MNDEFYEDEVIEGFYVPAMLKAAWGAQMDVFRETDRICQRHNIPYYADWGTLLAVIRHGGYIPWDDDFDISMRRSDYERFLRYAEKELPEGFKVMNFKNHPGHHFFVARIVSKPRICFEEDHLTRFHGFPYIVGVDLFVLDNVCRNRDKERLKAKKAEFVLTVADNIADGKTTGSKAYEQLDLCEGYTGKKIDRSLEGEQLRVAMYELVEELFSSIPDDESDALVQMMPYGLYGNERYIPKEYYKNTVRLPYMDTSVEVPICYDAVMRFKFGNYMEIHRKWAGHDYPFFYGQHEDLVRVLDFEYPSYKAGKGDLLQTPQRGAGLKQISQRYKETFMRYIDLIRSGDKDAAISLQGDAIELGTLTERVYGEGYEPVTYLERLCELAYRAYGGEDVCNELDKCLKDYAGCEKEYIARRRDIVFMPFAPKHWKYMEPVYRRYIDDDSVNVHVVPIPYHHKAYDGTFTRVFFDVDDYPAELDIKDHRTFELEMMHPEKLVIQTPFDRWNCAMSVDPEYYSDRIRKFTDELVYVPFFVTDDFTKEYGKEYINMDAYVCMPGVINADRILLPSETLKRTYTEKITEFTKTEEDKEVLSLLDKKIQVFPSLCPDDKARTQKVDPSGKKTIVWFTTISFLAEHNEKAINKIERILDVFGEHSDRIRIIWMTMCMDSLGLIDKKTADDFREAVKRFRKMDIGEYIEDVPVGDAPSYADMCDAYYGDPSAIALWFFYRKKPVMLVGVDV